MQVNAGLVPVALRGSLGDAEKLGDLGERESAEELEVHQSRQAWVGGLQLIERLGRLSISRSAPGGSGTWVGRLVI